MRFPSSTSTSSTTNRTSSRPTATRAAASSPCCASPTLRITCARSAWAGFSAPTKRARRRASPTAFRAQFGKELFPGDLDRLLPHVEAAMKRVPCLEHCGIKTIVNGPIAYTPDGSPLIGPACGTSQRLAQRGPQLRRHRRRRRRMAARRMDRRGRARHRHARRRPAPLRRLHRQALHGAQERGNVSQRLHGPLSRRGARGRATREDERRLREAEPDGRRLGTALRLGARQLVRAARASRARTSGASGAAITSSMSATNAG